MNKRLFKQTFFSDDEIIYFLPKDFESLNKMNGEIIIEPINSSKSENIENLILFESNITEFRTTSGRVFDQVVISNPKKTDDLTKIIELLMEDNPQLKNKFYKGNDKIQQQYERIESYFYEDGSSMMGISTFFIVNLLHVK